MGVRTKFPNGFLQVVSTMCGLCDNFNMSKSFYDTDKKCFFRVCKITKEEVTQTHKGCPDNFILTNHFSCLHHHDRITPEICVNRYENKRNCRKECTIGKMVRKLLGR